MLPYIQTTSPELSKIQTTWASQINPVLIQPILQGTILPNVVLSSGANVIPHRLGRNLRGWLVIRLRSSATFFDTQDTNQYPDLNLNLTASAGAVVDLLVF